MHREKVGTALDRLCTALRQGVRRAAGHGQARRRLACVVVAADVAQLGWLAARAIGRPRVTMPGSDVAAPS